MLHPVRSALVVSCLLLSLAAVSRLPLAAQNCDFTPVVDGLQGVVDGALLVDGAAVWLETGDGSVAEATYLGTYDSATVIPIASASKLLSAVAILTLVDDGLLQLDAPVSTVLPQFTGLKGTMTLRQMFSHTSGLPGGSQQPILADSSITLAQAVDQIACCVQLDAPPGTQFAYGGLSMHVAGRMAEVVTGQSWCELFAQRVATPLGLTSTDYFGLGITANPRVAGGARSTLDDYAKVLRMLRDRGRHDGVSFLSVAALQIMSNDQTAGVPIVDTPAGDDRRYGFGVWLDRVSADGQTLRISSPGAFGFTPWIDLDLHLGGIFMVEYWFSLVRDTFENLQDVARAEVQSCVPAFIRGDVNLDQSIDISDPIALLAGLFSSPGSVPVGCQDRLDTNDDGAVDLADPVRLLAYLFGPTVPLPPPGALCGLDVSQDILACNVASCP